MAKIGPPTKREAVALLTASFRSRGYARRVDPQRRIDEGPAYKKGDEVRLVAGSKAELARLRRALRAAGFAPGKPFAKARRWCQPLYGRSEVARFLALVEPQPA